MKSYRKELWFEVPTRRAFINITSRVEEYLSFPPWEQIFYGEFDGRRQKRVLIKIIGE